MSNVTTPQTEKQSQPATREDITNSIVADHQPARPNRYVDAVKLLEILFDEASRPSLRWIRDCQKRRAIPFCKIGRRIFFDPVLVKYHLDAKATVRGGAR